MNKNYLSFTIIVSVLLLAGCTAKSTAPTGSVAPVQNPVGEQSQAELESNAKKMMRAMDKGGSITCVIAKTDGTDTITFKVKGKKTKAMGESFADGKGMGYMINDTENMYIWNDKDKEGIKLSLKAAVPSGSPVATNNQYEDFTKDDVEKEYEEKGYRYDCTEGAIADSEFVPPKTVIFTDTSKMMEESSRMMQQYNAGKTPSPAEMKQYEETMKKYGNESEE